MDNKNFFIRNKFKVTIVLLVIAAIVAFLARFPSVPGFFGQDKLSPVFQNIAAIVAFLAPITAILGFLGMGKSDHDKVELPYLEQLDSPKALTCFEEDLADQIGVSGPAHEEAIKICSSLASAYDDMAPFENAMEYENGIISVYGDDAEKSHETFFNPTP